LRSLPSRRTVTWLASAAQVGGRAAGIVAIEYRTGNDPVVAGLEFAVGQVVQRGADPGLEQARVAGLRAGQGDDAVGVEAAAGEQVADGDHVLVAHGPDRRGSC
jgi:hypothetical protein